MILFSTSINIFIIYWDIIIIIHLADQNVTPSTQSHSPIKIWLQLRLGLREAKNSVVKLNWRAMLKQLSPLCAPYILSHTTTWLLIVWVAPSPPTPRFKKKKKK